jgi:hypothetical protein
MHGPINVKSPNNISKWQMGFNSEFKGLNKYRKSKQDEKVSCIEERTINYRKKDKETHTEKKRLKLIIYS